MADLQDMACPVIEEPDDLRVELVNRLAVIGDVHAEGWDSGCWFSDADGAASLPASACVNCSGGAVARPGSTVKSDSGFSSGTRRSSLAAGRSAKVLRPKYSRKSGVVP